MNDGASPAPLCPLCGARLDTGFVKLKRRVHTCPACRHITVPAGVVVGSDGRSIYESDDPVFEQDGNIEYYLDEANALAAKDKVAFVGRFCAERCRLLDAGASYGHFLAAVSPHHDAWGLEVNRGAVEWSIQKLGVRNAVGSVYEPSSDLPMPFDVITAWDVIEHLAEPRQALDACRKLLRPGGWLFLSTPDAGSLAARAMGRHWHYLDPLQHINLFSRKNLARLLEETGFSPQGWDYFGHRYRLSYVFNRLSYLTRHSRLQHLMRAACALGRPFQGMRVTIKIWDVMGVAAQVPASRTSEGAQGH